jgi:hypothetical protein
MSESLSVKIARVRLKGDIEFHAHSVEEALGIEDGPLAITVGGLRSGGEPYTARVQVPRAFPYVMMKLHAFADRESKGETGKARQHALDLYTVVGIMTEEEYQRAVELGEAHAGDKHVERARAITRDHFSGRTAIGALRLREHELYREEFQLDDFMTVLAEIFPPRYRGQLTNFFVSTSDFRPLRS